MLLFIYLAVLGLSCGIFNCGMQILSYGLWYLVPQLGIEPRLPALGA